MGEKKAPRAATGLERGGALPARNQLKALYEAHCQEMEEQLMALQRAIAQLLESQGLTPTIGYRVKRFENFYEKLHRDSRRRRRGAQAVINDVLGMRIICPFLEDIDKIEQILIANLHVIEVERKGSSHSFREFGYDSVHLLLQLEPFAAAAAIDGVGNVCEIQLRTILQDAWAEVEHELVYKSPLTLPNESVKRKLAALNANLCLSDIIFQELRDFQREVRRRDAQRRASLAQGVDIPELLCLVPLPGAESAAPALAEAPQTVAGGQLEKLLLAALDAHSRNDLQTAEYLYGRLLALRLEPGVRALVCNHRGMARFARGCYREALADFWRALRADPENTRALTNRALAQRMLGRFDQALADYEEALALRPADAQIYWGRAQLCYELGLLVRALGDCEKTLELHEENFTPASNLAAVIRRKLTGG